jgi:hypothetical protein
MPVMTAPLNDDAFIISGRLGTVKQYSRSIPGGPHAPDTGSTTDDGVRLNPLDGPSNVCRHGTG